MYSILNQNLTEILSETATSWLYLVFAQETLYSIVLSKLCNKAGIGWLLPVQIGAG